MARPPVQDWIVEPEGEHKHTFILLHGRGDLAYQFGAGLLMTGLPEEKTLRSLYRDAKFIFLQAPLRELASWPGTSFYQWFDVWDLKPGSEESHLQIPDLKDTVQLVHRVLGEEIALVGGENVVLGGLSQGCASSLISTLLWDGEPFAACIGMSGWLPFRKVLESAIPSEGEVATGDAAPTVPEHNPIAALAGVLGYQEGRTTPHVFQKIPFFLGHGTEDDTVVTSLGREAATCIRSLKAKVTFKEYQDLDHWYSPEMVHDITEFLQEETAWDID